MLLTWRPTTCFSQNDQNYVPGLYTLADIFPLSPKGRLIIHILTIARFPVNMESENNTILHRQKICPHRCKGI